MAEITTRLSQVPTTFLDERVQVSALAGHVLAASPTSAGGGRVLTVTQVARKLDMPAPRRGIAIALWLWASVETQGPFSVDLGTRFADRALAAMAFRLAAVVEPAEWIRDADRRDEAARTFLLWLGYLPAGEDVAAARGTLAMRDSLQQDAALLAAFAEHEHRLDVNRRLQAARAREASARYSHE
ncbi:MAG: phosphohydrolase [Glaciihabitans sp.]|nr:phosphohydrolase [Glaciihabitans sp.]